MKTKREAESCAAVNTALGRLKVRAQPESTERLRACIWIDQECSRTKQLLRHRANVEVLKPAVHAAATRAWLPTMNQSPQTSMLKCDYTAETNTFTAWFRNRVLVWSHQMHSCRRGCAGRPHRTRTQGFGPISYYAGV